MNISDLLITQDGFRNFTQVKELSEQVKSGKIFHDRYKLITILQTEDGLKWVTDGHHALGSLVLGNRPVLYSNEYHLIPMTYAMLNSINWMKSWVTPFDPRTHVRLADFHAFKDEVLNSVEDRNLLEKRIRERYNEYLRPRAGIWKIQDLLEKYT